MRKVFLVLSLVLCFILININKVHANSYDYFPLGDNYIDPGNHSFEEIEPNLIQVETINPFVVKDTKVYSLFVSSPTVDYILNYEFSFYDNENKRIDADLDYIEGYNSDGKIIKVTFTTPYNTKRISICFEFSNKFYMGGGYREVIDQYFVFCEGSDYPGPIGSSIEYQGPMQDLEPVIEGSSGLYITNVNDPVDVEEIKSALKAYDETDGDVTDSIIIYEDNYSENKNVLGLYEVIFRANDSRNNCTYFTVFIQVVDIDAPVISGTLNLSAYNNQLLTQSEIINNLVLTDNYNLSSLITLELVSDDYTANYNIVGRYELVFRATDTSGNSSEESVFIDVIDAIKPIIDGPMSHIKSNSLDVSLEEFISLYTAIDETDGDITSKIKVITDNYSINQYNTGVWEVVLSVSDAAGNEEIIVIEIEVIDEIGPVFFIDKSKIIIDLNSNPLSTLDLINYFQEAKIIRDDAIVEIIEDTYSENKNTPGTYKLVLGYEDERLEIEVEILEEVEKVEEETSNSIIKKIINILLKIFKIIFKFIKCLF